VRLWRQQPVDLRAALAHDGHPADNGPQGPCSPALTPDNSGAAVTYAPDTAQFLAACRVVAKHGYHVIEDVEGSCPTCGRET
jgi:hypothetical protein